MGDDPLSAQFIAAFVRANTRLRPVPRVPEILLHGADATVPLYDGASRAIRQAAFQAESFGRSAVRCVLHQA